MQPFPSISHPVALKPIGTSYGVPELFGQYTPTLKHRIRWLRLIPSPQKYDSGQSTHVGDRESNKAARPAGQRRHTEDIGYE